MGSIDTDLGIPPILWTLGGRPLSSVKTITTNDEFTETAPHKPLFYKPQNARYVVPAERGSSR